jgi:hypothetical protein
MRRITIAAVSVAAAAALATGCSSHSVSSITPAEKASASALASVPGADAKQILISAGVPINGTSAQQIAFMHKMATKANREALYTKLGIPPQNKASFEAAVLTAVKADVTTHAGHVKFFDTDLPNAYTAALVVKS